MLSFPNIAGPYKVGATTFLLPLRSLLVIGSAKLRHGKDGLRPALPLEEVAFTAFYPADTSENNGSKQASKGVDWLSKSDQSNIRPVSSSLRGYAHFRNYSKLFTWLLWPFIYLIANVKVPVHANAPLLSPTGVLVDGRKPDFRQWPLVIFSHGLGGSRTVYSQLCSRIAASGRVVIAMEHHDGSGHVCVKRSPSGAVTTKLYIRNDEVIWEAGDMPSDPGTFPFRKDQLTFRRHEIYLAHSAFSSLVGNDHNTENLQLRTIDGSHVNLGSWFKRTSDDLPRVRCDADVALVGHSFGGATVFSLLSNPPPTSEYPQMPATHALVLDPWLEPLPSPGPVPYSVPSAILNPELTTLSTGSSSELTLENGTTPDVLKSSPLPRMLVLNSDPFTLWKDHFERLKGVVEAWEPSGRRVLTLARSVHISFSDFPLLPIMRKASAEALMNLISKLAVSFLDGKIEDALRDVRTRKMEIEVIGMKKDGSPKRRCIGEIGDVIVH